MADPVHFLTSRDVALLREMRELIKRVPVNEGSPQPTDVHSPYLDSSQSPEVYILRTKSGGIPAAYTQSNQTGTGSIYDYLVPGVADCRVLTFIEDPTMGVAGDGLFQVIDTFENRTYNISFDPIAEFTWVMAMRVKGGQYVAVGTISPPENQTGTGTCSCEEELGCYVTRDEQGRITLDLDALFGDGFQVSTGTGSCPPVEVTIEELGCYLRRDEQGRITVDIDELFGEGFELSTGTGSCPSVDVIEEELGCYITRDELGRITINLDELFGEGFEESTGTGDCPGVQVADAYVDDIVDDAISNIPYGCGIVRMALTGLVRLNLSSVVNDGLFWDNDNCLLDVVPGCHVKIDPPPEEEDPDYPGASQVSVDVTSLAGDNQETGLKKYDAADCSPLSNDYVVARSESRFVVTDDRTLMVGTILTQFQVLTLWTFSFNAANELILWEEGTPILITREIVDFCTISCPTGTGTGTGTAQPTSYWCLSNQQLDILYICAALTLDQVVELVLSEEWEINDGPFETAEECELNCPGSTGTGSTGTGSGEFIDGECSLSPCRVVGMGTTDITYDGENPYALTWRAPSTGDFSFQFTTTPASGISITMMIPETDACECSLPDFTPNAVGSNQCISPFYEEGQWVTIVIGPVPPDDPEATPSFTGTMTITAGNICPP